MKKKQKFKDDLLEYIGELLMSGSAFAERIKTPPRGSMNRIAAAEWRRVAPRLYEMKRFEPLYVFALHAYCTAYAFWLEAFRELNRRDPKPREFSEFVEARGNNVKQLAREFGFFLDDNGRMNLDQPLPLGAGKRKKRKR